MRPVATLCTMAASGLQVGCKLQDRCSVVVTCGGPVASKRGGLSARYGALGRLGAWPKPDSGQEGLCIHNAIRVCCAVCRRLYTDFVSSPRNAIAGEWAEATRCRAIRRQIGAVYEVANSSSMSVPQLSKTSSSRRLPAGRARCGTRGEGRDMDGHTRGFLKRLRAQQEGFFQAAPESCRG